MSNATYERTQRETEALTFGRYELTHKLSQGGMAEIYLARQSGIEHFEKQVVVKIVLPQLAADADYEEMLRDEARMAARLNHPNIVQILDLGKLDGRFFIAMEYLEGQNLHSIAQRAFAGGGRLPIGFVCRVVADVLSGLEHAHAQLDDDGSSLGIIHRDVSPPNVIVTWAGTTKIVDFGIAKATGARAAAVTQAGQFKGKLGYMSPEQVRRQTLDARTDLFSTGVILWELLTGRRLFRRAGDVETVRAVLEHEVLPPSAYNPSCPTALDQIVLRALQRPLQSRYPSARAMRKALEELIRQQAWPSDSLTMQRVLSDLFREPTRPPRTAPRLVPEVPVEDNETTTRTIKADPEELDPVVELTAPFELVLPAAPPTFASTGRLVAAKERPVRVRRRFPIALGVAIGLAGCALATSVGRRAAEPPAPMTAAAPALATIGLPAAAPWAAVADDATVARTGAPELAVPSLAEPADAAAASAPARVEVRVDVKATVRLDGKTIEADTPVAVAVAGRHVVTVQSKSGRRSLRTLELPPLQPGQTLVVGLWLRDAAPATRAKEDASAASEAPRAQAAAAVEAATGAD